MPCPTVPSWVGTRSQALFTPCRRGIEREHTQESARLSVLALIPHDPRTLHRRTLPGLSSGRRPWPPDLRRSTGCPPKPPAYAPICRDARGIPGRGAFTLCIERPHPMRQTRRCTGMKSTRGNPECGSPAALCVACGPWDSIPARFRHQHGRRRAAREHRGRHAMEPLRTSRKQAPGNPDATGYRSTCGPSSSRSRTVARSMTLPKRATRRRVLGSDAIIDRRLYLSVFLAPWGLPFGKSRTTSFGPPADRPSDG